jgi:flagellar hook assembly protein FlgD
MHADSWISGSARLIDRHGTSIRKWTFKKATAGSWVWNGKSTAGRTVPDGRYILRVGGYDRAGNSTVRDLAVLVDRTIRSVAWSRASFIARSRQTSRVSFVLGRAASVTVGIYSGATLVRPIWQDRAFAAGRHGWTWNGRTSAGVMLKPGSYRVVVIARSSIGSSTLTRNVIVRAR